MPFVDGGLCNRTETAPEGLKLAPTYVTPFSVIFQMLSMPIERAGTQNPVDMYHVPCDLRSPVSPLLFERMNDLTR